MHARSLVLLVPLLLGCDSPFELSDCPEQVQVIVSSGTTPTIDWTPRCHLYSLLISAPGDLNQWGIHGPPQLVICSDDGGFCPTSLNTLFPPIQYGVVPRNAYQYIPLDRDATPPPLVAGYPYTFRLSRTNSEPGLVAIDTITITP